MFRILKMLASVPVVMACALGGTAGLLKAIERHAPDGDTPKGSAKNGIL